MPQLPSDDRDVDPLGPEFRGLGVPEPVGMHPLVDPGLPRLFGQAPMGLCLRNRASRPEEQDRLAPGNIEEIVNAHRDRPEKIDFARRVSTDEIRTNDYNLNISRYVSTAHAETEIDLEATHQELVAIEKDIQEAKDRHNEFLDELGLSRLP